ncbi:MAG: MFS transporter, partial [Pseudomonadota bacterium]
VGDTMPHDYLMKAMGLSRISMDAAKIAGALVGTGLFALLGIGYSYVIVASFYLASFSLTLGVSKVHGSRSQSEPAAAAGAAPVNAALAAAASAWRDLKDGLAYVWNTPVVLAMMCLAFIANLTAFPLSIGLLPYVARAVYRIDAIGLGHIGAAFACGALAGSITMTFAGVTKNAPRVVVASLLFWYAALAIFAQFETKTAGMVVLPFIGFFQSLSMVSMSVALLNFANERFRARVMGVRMLAIYGLPLGMLASGVLIASIGFSGTILLYCSVGATVTLGISLRWRKSLGY